MGAGQGDQVAVEGQVLIQQPGDVGVFGCVIPSGLQRNRGECRILGNGLREGDHFVPKMNQGQLVQAMGPSVRRQQSIGEQCVPLDATELNSVTSENFEIELEILAGLADDCVFQNGSEYCTYGLPSHLAEAVEPLVSHRHVPRTLVITAEGQADKTGAHGVQTSCFGIQGEF